MTFRASMVKEEVDKVCESLSPKYTRVVVEIGVHKGYSLEVWREMFNPCILIGLEDDVAYLDMEAVNNADAMVIHGDSHHEETKRLLEDELDGHKIDLLFIDGDHTYEGVVQDFEMYSPLVRKGGAILFHDAALKDHPLVEVHKFWDEIKGDACKFVHAGGTGMGLIYV